MDEADLQDFGIVNEDEAAMIVNELMESVDRLNQLEDSLQIPVPQPASAPQANALTPQRILQQLDVAWDTMSQNAEATSNYRDRLNQTLERYFIELRNRHYLRDPAQFEMDPEMHLTGAINDLAEQVAASTNAGTDFGIELADALDSYRDDLSNLLNRYRDQQLAVQMQPLAPAPQVAPMQQAEQLLQQIERPLRSTNDGIVNDALQEYARSLQRYASNQLQNGMDPITVANGMRDTINTLRNIVLTQPTDPTRNFMTDQLGEYVSALRLAIDGIGQWIEGQQQQAPIQPQRANLPAEVQQNIDNRNRQITSAYQRPLDPDSAFSNTNDALSEFIDLLDGMSTNLFGNGYNTSEIIDHLQARIRAEIIVLANPDNVTNRGLNGAEAEVLRNRLNNAYGSLAIVHDQLNAPAPQAPEPLQELPVDFFEPDATHPANQRYTMQSAVDMARNVFEQERTDANNFDIPSIEQSIYALREGLFDDDRIRRLPENQRQSFSEDVAFRLQNMLDDINARNRPPGRELVADPERSREAIDNALANIENDYGEDVANRVYAITQDISERINPGDELSEYVFQLRRTRNGVRQDVRDGLDHIAEELESIARERMNLNTAYNTAESYFNELLDDLGSDQRFDDLDDDIRITMVDEQQRALADRLTGLSDDEFLMVMRRLRENRPIPNEVNQPPATDNVFGITGRALPTPVSAQPATAPYRPLPANIAAMSDQAITADMSEYDRTRVQSMFESLTDVNSPEELRNIASLARSYAMGLWVNFSDVQREWLARNIEEYLGDNPPPNTPPPEGHKDGGHIRKYQDGGSTSDYGEPNNAALDAFDLMKLERWMSKRPEFHVDSKEFNDDTPDLERDDDIQVPKESTFDAKLQTPWEDDEWMMRNYIRKHYMETFAKGGTVHKKPSVEQMKYELMMRRA
jgi:hypothetical protein